MSIRPDRFLNAVYAWCVERIAPEKMEQWQYDLKAPLPGREKKATDAAVEDEGASFMAALAAMKG